MSLMVPVPIPWSCYLRAEALFDRQMGHGLAVRCEVLGLCSLPGRPLQVHVRLENGALWWRQPINHLVHGPVAAVVSEQWSQQLDVMVFRTDAPALPLHELQLWDCFDGEMEAAEVGGLTGRMMAYRRGAEWMRGRYLFTVDWPHDEYGASGHKCGHLIACDDGTYALQPNNRVCAYDPATVTPFCETGKVPRFRVRTYNDSCELRREGTGDGYHYPIITTMPGWNGVAAITDNEPEPDSSTPADWQRLQVEAERRAKGLPQDDAEATIHAAQEKAFRRVALGLSRGRDRKQCGTCDGYDRGRCVRLDVAVGVEEACGVWAARPDGSSGPDYDSPIRAEYAKEPDGA